MTLFGYLYCESYGSRIGDYVKFGIDISVETNKFSVRERLKWTFVEIVEGEMRGYLFEKLVLG